MAVKDSNSDAVRKPHHEAVEAPQRNAEAAMHRDSENVSPEARRDILAKSTPDTGSQFLKPMELVHNGQPLTDGSAANPDVKKLPGGGTIESRTDGAGTHTEVTRNQYHEMQRSVITRKDGSSSEYETKPNNGFKSTERYPDGSFVSNEQDDKGLTVIHHNPDGKGGFTDTTEKSDGSKKVHVQDSSGQYSESNYQNGVLQNQGRFAADGTPLPANAAKPGADAPADPNKPKVDSPTDPVGIAENQIEQWAKAAVDDSRFAGNVRNYGRIGLGAIGVGASIVPNEPILGTIGKLEAEVWAKLSEEQ